MINNNNADDSSDDECPFTITDDDAAAADDPIMQLPTAEQIQLHLQQKQPNNNNMLNGSNEETIIINANNSKSKKLFPQKLWDLINDGRFSSCLRWSDDGQLVYLNRDEFEESYLKTDENQFHTQKAISFVRQMNMYGFRKVDDCYYENDNFKRDCEYLLKNMTRKRSNKTAGIINSPTTAQSLDTTAQHANTFQQTSTSVASHLSQQNQQLFNRHNNLINANFLNRQQQSVLFNNNPTSKSTNAAFESLANATNAADIYGLLKKAQSLQNNGTDNTTNRSDCDTDVVPLKLKRSSNEMLLTNNIDFPSRKRLNNVHKDASLILQLANRNSNEELDFDQHQARTNPLQDQLTGNELNNNNNDFNHSTSLLANNNDLTSMLLNLNHQHNNNNNNNNNSSILIDPMHNNNINVPSNANINDGLLRTLLTFFAVQTMLTHTKPVQLDTK